MISLAERVENGLDNTPSSGLKTLICLVAIVNENKLMHKWAGLEGNYFAF
jgi:hypothetical protein